MIVPRTLAKDVSVWTWWRVGLIMSSVRVPRTSKALALHRRGQWRRAVEADLCGRPGAVSYFFDLNTTGCMPSRAGWQREGRKFKGFGNDFPFFGTERVRTTIWTKDIQKFG